MSLANGGLNGVLLVTPAFYSLRIKMIVRMEPVCKSVKFALSRKLIMTV